MMVVGVRFPDPCVVSGIHARGRMAIPPGETDLGVLLGSLRPEADPTVYVFGTLPPGVPVPAGLAPIAQFQESEGLTLIVAQAQADRAGLPYTFPCRRITLTVQSSLAAVGMLATIAQALAAEGISVNAVSAYFHDHLFVPCDRLEDALTCLHRLSNL